MSGYGRIYVVGGEGGFDGSDGVNPIAFLVLAGQGSRMWFEPHYFDATICPIASIRSLVPAGPCEPDALLDSCIAFAPMYFESCPSLAEVRRALEGQEFLDFDASPGRIPAAWSKLREEARAVFRQINIWQADLTRLQRPGNKVVDGV